MLKRKRCHSRLLTGSQNDVVMTNIVDSKKRCDTRHRKQLCKERDSKVCFGTFTGIAIQKSSSKTSMLPKRRKVYPVNAVAERNWQDFVWPKYLKKEV